MIIVGGTGTFRAGKGELQKFLCKRAFKHYSVSDFIAEVVISRKLPVNRNTMRDVANELRYKFGTTCIINSLIARAVNAGHQKIYIESLRALGEVRRIKELGGIVIGIDADPLLRFCRALACRSVKDHVTYEEFSAQERAETNNDPFKQNLPGCLKEADYVLLNNGTRKELESQIEIIMEKILARA